MLLQRLEISHFRNIDHAQLTPSSGLNAIIGPNASGKTSLLEAIYYLSWARSFRSKQARSLIKYDAREFALVAQLRSSITERSIHLGIKRTRNQILIRSQGQTVQSSSQLTRNFPVLLLGADSFQLITAGPRQRRRLMDWCLFHVEQGYLSTLKNYQHVLSQRNASLKRSRSYNGQLQAWNKQLAELALSVHGYRQAFIPVFEQHLKKRWSQIANREISVDYLPGWDTATDFVTELESRMIEDIKRGFTRYGPHTANLLFRVDGLPVSQSLSRGQLKRLIICVILTQADIYRLHHQEGPSLLIDDLPAELDEGSRTMLLTMIHKTGLQTFVTATNEGLLGDPGLLESVFHVEHGKLDKVVL